MSRAGEAFQGAGGQIGCVFGGWDEVEELQDLFGVFGGWLVAGGQVGDVICGLGRGVGVESWQVGEGLVGGLCGAW